MTDKPTPWLEFALLPTLAHALVTTRGLASRRVGGKRAAILAPNYYTEARRAVNALPALLAVVKALKEMICNVCDNRVGFKGDRFDPCAACEDARAALAALPKDLA